MRHERHAAAGRVGRGGDRASAEQLHQKPEPEQHERRQLEDLPPEEQRNQREDARARVEHEIRAHDARDGAAGADGRQRGLGIHRDLAEGGDDAAQQIEKDEASVAKAIFDVVAEDPEVPHVADHVHPPAM